MPSAALGAPLPSAEPTMTVVQDVQWPSAETTVTAAQGVPLSLADREFVDCHMSVLLFSVRFREVVDEFRIRCVHAKLTTLPS
jgi:hypothetical protein